MARWCQRSEENRRTAFRKVTVTQMTKVWTQHVKPWRTKAAEGFCCAFQTVGSEVGVNSMKTWIRPALCQMFRMLVVWWCGGLFLAHFGPLSTNGALYKHHRLPQCCCWPYPPSDDCFQTKSMPQITQMTSCFQLFLCVFLSVEHFVTSGSPHLPPSLPSISLHVRLHYICFFFSEVLSTISTVLPLHRSKPSQPLSPDLSRLILSIPVTPSENLSPVRSFQTSNFIVIEPSLPTF